MNTNGNADSIWKIINRYVRQKTHKFSVCWLNLQWKPRRHIPSLLPSTENCQFQPCSPIKKFGLRKYDNIPKGLKSLGWLDMPYKLNFNDCEIMMYKCLNNNAPEYLSEKKLPDTKHNCMTLRELKYRLTTGQQPFEGPSCEMNFPNNYKMLKFT